MLEELYVFIKHVLEHEYVSFGGQQIMFDKPNVFLTEFLEPSYMAIIGYYEGCFLRAMNILTKQKSA